MDNVATAEQRAVARPLKILADLIKHDIADAELAGRPHYEAAAIKLIEARDGHFDGQLAQFYRWAEKVTAKSQATIRAWMAFGSSTNRNSFKNREQFRYTPKDQGGLGQQPRATAIRRDWAAPVDLVAQRAHEEARRLALAESLTRQQEREAERKLALRLVDIGFRVLAKELHPDKLGGDRDAMARLNRVRDRLKECI